MKVLSKARTGNVAWHGGRENRAVSHDADDLASKGVRVQMSRFERTTGAEIRTSVQRRSAELSQADRHRRTSPRIGFRGRHEGQSLVEFAVVLPVFLLILAGILDFGLGLYSQMTVINAAREGARLGVVEPGNITDINDRVDAMTAGLDKSRLTVTITCERPTGPTTFGSCSSPQWQSNDAVRVQVDYSYKMLWPLALGNSLDLSSTVQMRIE
jgi:Flp pilus assembly protein TadG